jgi:hypothetical protein
MRFDIRGTAGEHEAIEPIEELIQAQLLRQRGNQQRHGFRGIQNRSRVFLAHRVKRMQPDHPAIGGNSNEWAVECHEGMV